MMPRGCVLIVDDEDLVLNVAQASLEGAGFSVLTASDGETAVEVFGQNAENISAVLLDLGLPKMSGEQVLESIRARRRDAAVVVASGYPEQDTVSRFVGERPTAFLKKPFRPRQLIAKIEEVIGG